MPFGKRYKLHFKNFLEVGGGGVHDCLRLPRQLEISVTTLYFCQVLVLFSNQSCNFINEQLTFRVYRNDGSLLNPNVKMVQVMNSK